ncbi:MAG TPA: flagellar basal body P-ring protein FlgI [Burkholderiales bacterium]|jgi:flagellar P-ring protein precursor FlgI|nr:flagellar basal body P-ring protein FlgI [Burkholderiales bacterium]
MHAMLRKALLWIMLFCGLAMLAAGQARAERLKDVVTVQGVRDNQLIGYGIVVGLDGTGDQTTQTPFTVQSLTTMLQQMGVNLPAGTSLQLKNVAAVMVTSQLPAFAQPGQPVDITVSSMGNAKSLRGGTLLLTPLKGADGQIYAMAQGNVLIAGAGESAGGSKAQINQLNAGRIPNGATVERAVANSFASGDSLRLELHATDFGTARRVADVINSKMGGGTALALDGRVIQVRAPQSPNDRVAFMAQLDTLEVKIGTAAAKIILNARTGSVVMNQSVTLEPCAVAHGNLSVTVNATPVISQPNALSQGGQTVVSEKADIQIKQDGGKLVLLEAGVKLADVVKALNTLGATPQDLLAILQAMQVSGALHAELEII